MRPKLTPEMIDEWLGQMGHDRPWLAQQLGMSPGSIYNSFSKGFSRRSLQAIEKLMTPSPSDSGGLEVEFTAAEFDRIEEARKLLGIATRKLFYEEAITEYAAQILAREEADAAAEKTPPARKIARFPAQNQSSLVAEESGDSGSSHRGKAKDKNGTED